MTKVTFHINLNNKYGDMLKHTYTDHRLMNLMMDSEISDQLHSQLAWLVCFYADDKQRMISCCWIYRLVVFVLGFSWPLTNKLAHVFVTVSREAICGSKGIHVQSSIRQIIFILYTYLPLKNANCNDYWFFALLSYKGGLPSWLRKPPAMSANLSIDYKWH